MTYVSESTRARNVEPVQLEGCHLAIVATRDLRRGEELLITYGAPYWLAQLGGVQRSDAAPNDADEGDGGERHGGGRRRRQGRQQRRGGSVHLDEEDEWSSRGGGGNPRRPRGGNRGNRRASRTRARRGGGGPVEKDDW